MANQGCVWLLAAGLDPWAWMYAREHITPSPPIPVSFVSIFSPNRGSLPSPTVAARKLLPSPFHSHGDGESVIFSKAS